MTHHADAQQLVGATYSTVLGWAERTPGAACVRHAGRTFTYTDLLDHVDAVRRVLVATGTGLGDLVAVDVSRRGPGVAGMLAAWSVGAAYLPLSPSLPPGRRQTILDIARPRVVLADADDRDAPAVSHPGAAQPVTLPASAAYVIFTSGSTGVPKGVVLGHDGLTALVDWHGAVTGLRAGEAGSQVADLAFDASVWEIWGTLAHGGTLVVPTLDELLDPPSLRDFLLEHEVAAGFVPTGLVPGLLDLDWPRQVPTRVVFTGGDRLTRWPEPRPPFTVVNAYGPTECTVVATCHPLDPNRSASGAPPIGRPLAHVDARVVDAENNPLIGAATGELWLGGVAVALGYLGAQRSTAFVDRDLGTGPARWYRTGDLVTRDDEGVLHYRSRIDDQVQIAGRRTEPSEIAHAILALPAVSDVVVFTHGAPSGVTRLAAAVTPAAVSRDLVHEHLRALLPTYMIPPDILSMDQLPTTDNGKFDVADLRQRLEQQTRDQRAAATLGPHEAALAGCWREACGLVATSPDDRLLDLGAGSLDLIALTVSVARRYAVNPPPGSLSLQQTLSEQARRIADLPASGPPPSAGGARSGRASVGQEAIVFLEEISGTNLGYQFQMVLEGAGAPDDATLERAFRAVLRSQPTLAARWKMTPGGLFGSPVETDAAVRCHTVHSAELDTTVAALVAQPMHYEDHPLVAWDVLHHGSGTVLVHREHHLVHDGWSVGVFLDLVQQAYQAFERGVDWTPPTTDVGYFDWAAEQRQWLDSPASAPAREYWRHHLGGATRGRRAVPWPTRPAEAGVRSNTELQPLGRARSTAVATLATALDVTPFAVLLAAFRRLIGECHDGGDSVIGSGFANRDALTQDIVGMFVNVLPLRRQRLTGETVADRVRAEMTLLAAAGRHQQLPTSEIVRLVCQEHRLDTTPLYQVMFSQHDAPMPVLRLGAWRPSIRELWNGHGKTDLNVIVLNRGIQHARHRRAVSRDAGEYTLRWEYDPAIYPDEVVDRLRTRYAELLDHACASDARPWPSSAIWNRRPSGTE